MIRNINIGINISSSDPLIPDQSHFCGISYPWIDPTGVNIKSHRLTRHLLFSFGDLFRLFRCTQSHRERKANIAAAWVYHFSHIVIHKTLISLCKVVPQLRNAHWHWQEETSIKKDEIFHCDHIIWTRNPTVASVLFYVRMIGVGGGWEAERWGSLCIKAKSWGLVRFHQILWLKQSARLREI